MKLIALLVATLMVCQLATAQVKHLTRDQRIESVLDALAAYNKQSKERI